MKKPLVPVVGHISKVFIDSRDARRIIAKGSGVMVNGVLHCLRSGIRQRPGIGHSRKLEDARDWDSGPTVIEYRHKQSGYAGPVVIQGERGVPKK